MKRSLGPLVAPITVGLIASACSSATLLTKSQAAHRYASIAARVNVVAIPFNREVYSGWTKNTPPSQIKSEARQYLAALQVFDRQLSSLAQQYPPASAEIRSEVAATQSLLGDLANIMSHTYRLNSWFEGWNRDDTAVEWHAVKVRSDLGLPPPPSES